MIERLLVCEYSPNVCFVNSIHALASACMPVESIDWQNESIRMAASESGTCSLAALDRWRRSDWTAFASSPPMSSKFDSGGGMSEYSTRAFSYRFRDTSRLLTKYISPVLTPSLNSIVIPISNMPYAWLSDATRPSASNRFMTCLPDGSCWCSCIGTQRIN